MPKQEFKYELTIEKWNADAHRFDFIAKMKVDNCGDASDLSHAITHFPEREIGKYSVSIKQIPNFEWEELPEHGDLMVIEGFVEDCKSGAFIDYDGFGDYSDGKRCISGLKYPEFLVKPSDIMCGIINDEFTHVVWYNR